jgi:hypothetical protein
MTASPHVPLERHPQPNITDLVVAPELAAIALLDAALDVAVAALLAQHMTLIDDLRPPGHDGTVVELANVVRRRASSLRHILARYVHAVRNAAAPDTDADLPF